MTNYVEGRNIYFSGLVNEESVSWLIFQLQKIDKEDDKKEDELKEYKREPITLYIMSFGGVVYHGLNAYDVIKACKTQVNTVCLTTMSAGFIIFLAGCNRKMYKNSSIMNHSLYHKFGGMLQDMTENLENCKKLQEMMDVIILENTKITKERQMEVIKTKEDWYIYSEEALELGIIDEII